MNQIWKTLTTINIQTLIQSQHILHQLKNGTQPFKITS